MGIEVLERWRAPRLILLLYREGPMMISEIKWKLKGSQYSLYNTLRLLVETGLVKERHEGEWPKRRLFELTDLGREVAELLARIEELLAKARGQEAG